LYLLDQSVHTSRWVGTRAIASLLPILKLSRSLYRAGLMWPQDIAVRRFFVTRHVLATKVLYLLPLDVCSLGLKVEQEP